MDTQHKILFSWIDYSLFAVMLGSSAIIGVYFGCFGSRQSTVKEYLLGGKTMSILPVAMSFVASQVSGILLLAVPADIYSYGASYSLILLCIFPISFLTATMFMPVFYKLQTISTYEYLEKRFDNKIRIIASSLNTISLLFFNPIVIYVPALAFAQVTGFHLNYTTPLVCVVCIFYTTIGGLKAVIWTDTMQLSIMIIASLVVSCIGLVEVGGFGYIFEKAAESNRLDLFEAISIFAVGFILIVIVENKENRINKNETKWQKKQVGATIDFEWDPTKRDSFWHITLGLGINWLYNIPLNQGSIQRFLAVPTIKDAKKVISIFAVGLFLLVANSVLCGLIMYAKYHNCDPIKTGQVERLDQIMPYYIMDVAKLIPGLPGIFIAGIFSAALSTLSTTLNSVAATIYEDFISPYMPESVTETRKSNILKLIVIIFGGICTALVFVVEHLDSILAITLTFVGSVNGPLLGLFCLGMLFPFANSKGALHGTIGGLLFITWIAGGAQYYKGQEIITYPTKPSTTIGCDFSVNYTKPTLSHNIDNTERFYLYKISFYYYTTIGALMTILIGCIVSMLTRDKNDMQVNDDLITPFVLWLMNKTRKVNELTEYSTVENALNITNNSDNNAD